ncbi:PAQR family membrane homeostasis protein TrhA [Corynebacterium anserum]|uniref:Hly III family transporter n=1 Tax=Corynebacterium anserum TaxID=2684406 RepID=A0A7G7YQZ3_9CORY|nr:Hly III family transporter [Corynebacterium anserum]QNH96913.1 Hly III family transporter [Corynebacterium anserum]
MRGRLHSAAAWYFGGTGTALTVVTAVANGASLMTLFTAIYALCLVGMLMVSALYHRAPWRSAEAIDGWRRADHAMIAVFIAGTYGPLTIGAFGTDFFVGHGLFNFGGLWILPVCWIAAIAAVVLNIFWINHPRWLDVVVYLTLGWLAVIGAMGYFNSLGVAVTLLMVLGGVVYSVGAIVYARKWPNPSERWFGFHEVFHAATIVAAVLHHVAIWLVVLS